MEKKNPTYIAVNIVGVVMFIACIVLSFTKLSSSKDFKLLCGVAARGIFGLLIIYNSFYLLFTRKWSFLCLNANSKQRTYYGALLGLVGLLGLITAIMGYGFNGNPRFIWWS